MDSAVLHSSMVDTVTYSAGPLSPLSPSPLLAVLHNCMINKVADAGSKKMQNSKMLKKNRKIAATVACIFSHVQNIYRWWRSVGWMVA